MAVSPAAALMWRLLAGPSGCGRARSLLVAWRGWERCSLVLWPTQPIAGARHGVLTIRPVPYRGPALELADGSVVRRGDCVLELHCDNRRVAEVVARGGENPFRVCREDLQSLAVWLKTARLERLPKALYGCTILTRPARRLGFSVTDRACGAGDLFQRIYMAGLLAIYHREGGQRLRRGRKPLPYPRQVWMSCRELFRRYGPAAWSATPGRAARKAEL